MVTSTVQQGLSGFVNSSTAFDSLSSSARNFTDAGSNPANAIDNQVNATSITTLQYPQDLGKYQFAIIESEFTLTNYINFKTAYRLPLPVPLIEHHTTNYDVDFNLLGQLANVIPNGSSGFNISGFASSVVQGAMGSLGLSVNQAKLITLKNPSFHTHDLNWKFSPKNFQESLTIRNIIFNLKKGMAPKLELGRTLFGFPNVYLMFFVPNVQFLYKFKPCVLAELSVDYTGGNPSPAFYENGNSSATFKRNFGNDQTVEYSVTENPPESIVLKTRWLELEYWVQEDFKSADSKDIFDVFNWYTNTTFGAAPNNPVRSDPLPGTNDPLPEP